MPPRSGCDSIDGTKSVRVRNSDLTSGLQARVSSVELRLTDIPALSPRRPRIPAHRRATRRYPPRHLEA
jgi:hypothetical protein